MRVARDAGDISSLFPPGIHSLTDLPFTIFRAIQTALFYLSFDDLPKQERPPKYIWRDNELMEQHWEDVERMREEQSEGRPDLSKMPQNDLVKDLLIRR